MDLRMYDELAAWWPLLSPPADYGEEADFYARVLVESAALDVREVLELGSGGGNNASHMKARFALTLVDLSPRMLAVSRALNPECEHVVGDMRRLRLGRQFDAVFVHDAICYMTSEEDLRLALETAFVHTRPGGSALFAPDYTRETFRPSTEHGGEDGAGRALRFLEWTWDPDPTDGKYTADYVLVLREVDGSVRVEHDQHVEGLFARDVWLRTIESVGYCASLVPFEHSELASDQVDVFIGRRTG